MVGGGDGGVDCRSWWLGRWRARDLGILVTGWIVGGVVERTTSGGGGGGVER